MAHLQRYEQREEGESILFDVSISPKEVVKKFQGEIFNVSCKIPFSQLKKITNNELIIEAWTNINSKKYSAYPLLINKDTGSLSAQFILRTTGFFKITIRYRYKNQKFWTWLSNNNPDNYSEIHVDPAYIKKSIVYNAFIRFFGHKKLDSSGEINFGDSGTFDDLKQRLDYIKNLGADILYLNPIHVIGDLYRNYNPHDQFPNYLQPGCPYSIKDYKSIDPELGIDKDHELGPHASLSDPMKEFKELVKEAHKRNIKVYMDLVFNHTSHDFILQRLHPEWYFYKENIKSLEEPYIYPEEIKEGKPWGDAKHTMCPYDHGYWWEDAAQLNWEYMIQPGSNEPPKNPTLNEMYEYFKSIPKYWIKHFGIDGFRCDVAYRVPSKFWKECIHEARELAKKEHLFNGSITGDVVFIAETYCDKVDDLFKAGFSAAYGDFSNKLYNPLTLKGYLDYMYNVSEQYFPKNSLFFTFPECHDFHRASTKIIGNNQDETLGERTNKSRWVLTAMLPGIPMIFNGFEKIEWHPVNLFSYSDIDWEADTELREYITKVNKIRNKEETLQQGDYRFVETNQGLNEGTQIFSFLRTYRGETFLICVNMDVYNSTHPTKLFLPVINGLDLNKDYDLIDLLNEKQFTRTGNELTVILEPGESHIFKIEQK